MKTDYRITRENFDMDLARMCDRMAVEAANDYAESFKNQDGRPVYLKYGEGCLPTDGCKVSMKECAKCAHSKSCLLRRLRLVVYEVASAVTCNVSKYYEKLEGGRK